MREGKRNGRGSGRGTWLGTAVAQRVEATTAVELFEQHWRILGGPPLVAEYVFAPPRKFRFDYAHLDTRIAVEIEGGIYTAGRHVRAEGYDTDCQKYNLAAAEGWLVFRYTVRMLRTDPVGHLVRLLGVIEERRSE